jgi:cbb3-type cytochrome oxidase subunit 3
MFWTIAILIGMLLLATVKAAYSGVQKAEADRARWEKQRQWEEKIRMEARRGGASLNQATRRHKK